MRSERGEANVMGLIGLIVLLVVAIIVTYVVYHFAALALGDVPFGGALAALVALLVFLGMVFGGYNRFGDRF